MTSTIAGIKLGRDGWKHATYPSLSIVQPAGANVYTVIRPCNEMDSHTVQPYCSTLFAH